MSQVIEGKIDNFIQLLLQSKMNEPNYNEETQL